MNSRWQANKIGLINFWYYDEQEFPFVKGRILLRGSNGSGKSVTMQSVVPLLLDGNMSPERLDPFGSRDRKMSSYLLEENDGREERTGYLYLEFKRKDSETYLTIGMGIRARRGKPLDKWYFSLTDGRRIGKDFFLYKDIGEKVTLSKKELENRVADGGRVFERQVEYMEYVNRQIFGFETADEYKEMVDLLIQLRTPKLSKDFKPSVINDILSDSLQPLSDEDLRPMSEAIENMDTMNMNLKGRREAKQAAEKIYTVFNKYNKILLYDKADRYMQAQQKLQEALKEQKEYQDKYADCTEKIRQLELRIQDLNGKRETFEKEKESLSKSDAVALKTREVQLVEEIAQHSKILAEKNKFLASKEEQYRDVEKQVKEEEDRKYEKEKEIDALLEEMQDEAEQMAFQEFVFMKDELCEKLDEPYKFDLHRQQFDGVRKNIQSGFQILEELKILEKQKDEMLQAREKQIRELDQVQRKIAELEDLLIQVENEWKEAFYKWNEDNTELKLDRDLLGRLSTFADHYDKTSDFVTVRQKVGDKWAEKNAGIVTDIGAKKHEWNLEKEELSRVKIELAEWENQKEPQPERPDTVVRNRERLKKAGIPYQEFYKVIEFGAGLDDETCDHLEEALLKMGILDAIVVEEQYKEQVLVPVKGCEDHYLFAGKPAEGKSLLDVLELNENVNDIFSNQRLTGILSNISYGGEEMVSITSDGTYHMGVLTGTVTGEYQAGYLGIKARERNRLVRIEECKKRIAEIEENIALIQRLDTCVSWLKIFPQELQKQVAEKTQTIDKAQQIEKDQKTNEDKISLYEHRAGFFAKCYESEKGLAYVKLPDQIVDDVKHIQEYLATDVKGMDKDSVITNLNQVYFENRIFLTDHQLTQSSLFEDFDKEEKIEGFSAKRLDISARYQGIKVSFTSLLTHLEEDILELENLIKDGDRELFEDILANTVSRKIRGKINASNIWVQKMNRLMNGMDTSSGLKLSLRWRSKTAEKEDQLDTRELVELLKKDYRLMSEEEAAKLSSHFRSKVDEARRSARESSGMISFYQIMKETLDYRKWFEFQLFSQKSGERQKELTNSVFGTFSGGEKAMSMYVPLFSAVVAKYQGGREDAPRLISLDEAFAGVDNRNIRDMFRLMTQFGFDFIINSQVLWGDCDTLDALAIYQLIRPENAKFVTVMPYLWNGHGKELLDDEESVEQRGIELETSES